MKITVLETLYGLLVVKDGSLVAEDYFNAGSPTQIGNRQSVAKRYTSALVGIGAGWFDEEESWKI